MAFIGLFAVMTIAICAVIFLGVASIIIGTILIKRTGHKKLGMVIRILGYIILIPTIVITVIMIVIMKGKLS